MAKEKRKNEPALEMSDLGVIEMPIVSEYRVEAEKILRFEEFLDILLEVEEQIIALEKLAQADFPSAMSQDARDDFLTILRVAKDEHDQIFDGANQKFGPYLSLHTQGAQDLSAIASLLKLKKRGEIHPGTTILPGSHTQTGHEVIIDKIAGLESAADKEEVAQGLPKISFLKRRALLREAGQDRRKEIEALKIQSADRRREREDAAQYVRAIDEEAMRKFETQERAVSRMLHGLERARQVFANGSLSTHLKAEEALVSLRRSAKKPDDKSLAHIAERAIEELTHSEKFPERVESAQDKIREALRLLKHRLQHIDSKAKGLTAIARLFDTSSGMTSDKEKYLSGRSLEVSEKFDRLHEAYELAVAGLDNARDQLNDDSKGGETPEARALVDYLLENALDRAFAEEFYKLSNEIVDDLEGLAGVLRAPSPRLDKIALSSATVETARQLEAHEEPSSEQSIAGERFEYNAEKAKEYGFSELKIERHEKAQVIMDAVYARDPRFVTLHKAGQPDPDTRNISVNLTQDKYKLNERALKDAWNRDCPDLPNTPEQSVWFFVALMKHRLSETIDNDDSQNLDQHAKDYVSTFGQDRFMLAMDYAEFDYNNATEKANALTPQTKKILKTLFGVENPTVITRDEVNTALWSDHENRINTPKARQVIQELLGPTANPDDFELRLMRYDEYARGAKDKSWGQKGLWTHMDGYYTLADGRRNGLNGGNRHYGGGARVGSFWRDNRYDAVGVRVVLSRRNP